VPLERARPLALGVPSRLGRLDRLALERATSLRLGLERRRGVSAGSARAAPSRLGAQLEPLDPSLQPVASRNARLASPGGVGELLLGASPIGEKAFQPALGAFSLEGSRIATFAGFGSPRAGVGEIELRDPCLDARDLDRELLCPLCRRRLERQRRKRLRTSSSTSRARSTCSATRASFSSARCRRLLNFPSPAALLDECTPVLGPGRKHLLDLALAHDGVHRRTESDVREGSRRDPSVGPRRD
jgi:hypothetical protein